MHITDQNRAGFGETRVLFVFEEKEMIKKTLTWKDFNEVTHTEEFYFHLMENEIVELELSKKGGLGSYLQTMVQSDDRSEIIAAFKTIISGAYGKRSDDGSRFDKDPQWTNEFVSSLAYNALFMELVTSEEKAIEFILGIMPKDLSDQIDLKQALANPQQVIRVQVPVAPTPSSIRPLPGGLLSEAELTAMSKEDLMAYLKDRYQDKGPQAPPPAA